MCTTVIIDRENFGKGLMSISWLLARLAPGCFVPCTKSTSALVFVAVGGGHSSNSLGLGTRALGLGTPGRLWNWALRGHWVGAGVGG